MEHKCTREQSGSIEENGNLSAGPAIWTHATRNAKAATAFRFGFTADSVGECVMSTSAVMNSSWVRLGEVRASDLVDARLQLHHAAQIAVSAAISYIPARSDDSHTALTWSTRARALTTEPITTARPLRIAVRVEDLTLQSLDENNVAMQSFALPGRMIAEGHAWLGQVVAQAGLDSARLTSRKHYTIPAHPVASGSAFSLGARNEFVELSNYLSNAAGLLEELVRTTPGASAVRTWPHHFDIATLIELPGEPRRTVGIGQSPGDDSYAEPYWYIGPYPYPPIDNLPALAGGGHWHTKGWVGAALPASAFVDTADQRAQVSAFIDSAVAACRQLLGS